MSEIKERLQQKRFTTKAPSIEQTEKTTTLDPVGTARAADKYRVQLDFSGNAVAELDQLKEILGASTRADVVRNALRWLFWCAEQVLRGATILLEQDGKQREVVFPFVTRKLEKAAEASRGASA